ncbi:MAG: hypothetical protein HYU38_12200 [Candidatus Tectomicrobia bacterium]|nr:hypothetical protein [Candidatus Tectomicrobia bacterium]
MKRAFACVLVAGTFLLAARNVTESASKMEGLIETSDWINIAAKVCKLLPPQEYMGCTDWILLKQSSCNDKPKTTQDACKSSLFQYLSKTVLPKCIPLRDPQQDQCVRTALGLPAPPDLKFAKELVRLQQLRSSVAKERAEAVGLCRKMYQGDQEVSCVRAFYPAAPGPGRPGN